jgi:hypothetical protein
MGGLSKMAARGGKYEKTGVELQNAWPYKRNQPPIPSLHAWAHDFIKKLEKCGFIKKGMNKEDL